MTEAVTGRLASDEPLACDVSTATVLAASSERLWKSLLYYEQIDQRPGWLLRWLLPVPVRTEGQKSNVGDEAMCHYERGYLRKRVTEVDVQRLYRFSVVEQVLMDAIELRGGAYELEELSEGRTRLRLRTHYVSRYRPRWLFKPVEKLVCHAFHRHILSAVGRGVRRSLPGGTP